MAKPRPRKKKSSKVREEKDKRGYYFSLFVAFLLVFSIFAAAYSSGFFSSGKKLKLPETTEVGKLSREELDFIVKNGRAVLEIVMPENCTVECERVYGEAVQLAQEFSPVLYLSSYRTPNATALKIRLYTPLSYYGVEVENLGVVQEMLCNITYPKPEVCILKELLE